MIESLYSSTNNYASLEILSNQMVVVAHCDERERRFVCEMRGNSTYDVGENGERERETMGIMRECEGSRKYAF